MDEASARRNRDLSARTLAVGVVLLLVFGLGYSSSQWLAAGGGAGILAIFAELRLLVVWLFIAILALCLAAAIAWMYWGFRLRRLRDPWAYDPDLDGPDPQVRRGLEEAEREAEGSTGSGRH